MDLAASEAKILLSNLENDKQGEDKQKTAVTCFCQFGHYFNHRQWSERGGVRPSDQQGTDGPRSSRMTLEKHLKRQFKSPRVYRVVLGSRGRMWRENCQSLQNSSASG